MGISFYIWVMNLGLLIPSQGEIFVDGKNILTNLAGWQQQIGYIAKSIYLSDDTI
jgi:ATP-binding cassette, subfamily B, bacterial PglK